MAARGGSWRLRGRVVGLWAMRESAVHATWPRSVSRRSWSFSPINSVVPRSRLPLPQAGRDAERLTGEPGVALLAGVRGENSPHYTKRPPKGKNSTKKIWETVFLAEFRPFSRRAVRWSEFIEGPR